MRFRSAVAVSAVAVAVLAGTSHAAPKMSCNLVTDAAGDVNNAPAFPADGTLDLVGGDIASNGKNITGVIKLASEPGSATVYIKRYVLQFSAPGLANPALLALAISATGATYSWGYYGTTATGTGYSYPGTATGAINGKEISITASLEEMAGNENVGRIKPGAKISGITALSFRRVPPVAQVTGQVFAADDATTKKTYFAGARSCVKVG